MPKNQYSLRSKDVQEVLSTPPRKVVFWGNVIVLSSFILFLIMLNNMPMPVKIKMTGQILSVTVSKASEEIRLLMSSNSVHGRIIGKTARLSIDDSATSPVVIGVIKEITAINHALTVEVKFDESRSPNETIKAVEFLRTKGQILVEVRTDTVSALNLFKTKLLQSLRH